MRTMWVVVLIAAGVSLAAGADSIKVGDKVLENVYITEGSGTYYVSIPEDGTVQNIAKSDVDPKGVVISPDREARKALYEAWLDKRKSQRGEVSSAEADAEVVNVVEQPKKEEPAEKTKTLKKISGTGSGSTGSSGSQGAWDPAQQYNDSIRAAREAQLAARRRNRESEKVRMLTQRQVITSESSGVGKGGMGGMNQGGLGMGGMGGGMGNGYR